MRVKSTPRASKCWSVLTRVVSKNGRGSVDPAYLRVEGAGLNNLLACLLEELEGSSIEVWMYMDMGTVRWVAQNVDGEDPFVPQKIVGSVEDMSPMG